MTRMPGEISIESVGLFTERFSGLAALQTYLASRENEACESGSTFCFPDPVHSVHVRPNRPDKIEREDRSILNDISILVVNATGDAIAGLPSDSAPEQFGDAPIFIGSDGAEHSFTALNSVVRENQAPESVYARLGYIRDRANPIDMLRFLSTNPVYHASKQLRTHGGAYPIRAASLSGLVALEESISYLEEIPSKSAIVIAAGNMRSFDSLVTFNKLGLISLSEPRRGPSLSYGAVCLLLCRRSRDVASRFARVLAVKSFYLPDSHASVESWRRTFDDALDRVGRPDTVVLYSIGVPSADQAERTALAQLIPEVPVHAYKRTFGYTGKANNLLDLAAVMADPAIEPGKKVLITGAGLGYGVGYIAIEKGRNATN